MKCWVGIIAVLCSVVWVGAANAQGACDPTSDRYQAVFRKGVTLSSQEKYDEALEVFEGMRDACPEDPVPYYGIGAVREAKGECNTALKLFRESLRLWDASAEKADASGQDFRPAMTRDKINDRLLRVLDECVPRSLYTVTCAGEGVQISIDGGELRACPVEGESSEGAHTINATREGYLPYETTMTLKKGERVQVTIPALEEIPRDEGVLVLNCPAGVDEVELALEGEDGEDVACPSEHILKPGRYLLTMSGPGDGQVAVVEQGKTTQLFIQEVGAAPDKLGLFLTLRGGTGHAFVGRRQLHKDADSPIVPVTPSGDALAPTLPTGALINEIGYYFNESFGVGARLRFNFPEFSFAGGAFFRWIPWSNEYFGIQTDVILGGGDVHAAFEFESGTGACVGERCLVLMGSVFTGLSLGANVRLSDLFSFVIVVDGLFFFYHAEETTEDATAIHLDYTAGIEVAF